MRLFTAAVLAVLLVSPLLALPPHAAAQDVRESPSVVLSGVPFQVTLAAGAAATVYEVRTAGGAALARGSLEAFGSATASGLVVRSRQDLPLTVVFGDTQKHLSPTLVPGWYSLVPPLVAIALALLIREVVTALFAGVWLGALAVAGFDPLAATWRVIDRFVVPALGDLEGGHVQIVVFSLLLGGMVGVISRNGGSVGIVEAVGPFARTARRGRIATWIAGMGVFFDDYANTLLVGNTMRPITDRLRISREKLAYLVDTTAAPVAAIVPVSTWVGYEISLIADGLRIAAEQNSAASESLLALSPFTVFIETIPFRFYPLLALYFAALTAFTRRDFGAMARAEVRAAAGGGVHRPGARLMTDTTSHAMEAKPGAPLRWWNALVPVLTVVAVVLAGLWTTGRRSAGPDASIFDVLGAADPFVTLLWGSLAGCLVAIVLSVGQRILTLTESIDAWIGGMRSMFLAMIILTLAWSLGAVTEEVGTAPYLSQVLSGHVALGLLPAIVFATAAAMSFATGTSWGTMAILLPLVVPLTVSLGGYADTGGEVHYTILLGTISSVLAGSIFGDHCSPISDTTVLSSMASGCDHLDHVRTQMPYALLVAGVGMLLGDVGTAYGLPVWIALGASMLVLWAFLRYFGRDVDAEARRAGAASATALPT
jgi:Na+/H+ antiporter NhaC